MSERREPLSSAQIASKAQAAAHKKLREEHPRQYREAYQAAKTELTEENTR